MDLYADQMPVNGHFKATSGSIHYLAWGDGNPEAHFLHANGLCAGTYAPFLVHLASRLRILASDIRGHGDSAPLSTAKIPHWRIFAKDLRELLERHANGPIVGIGHSLGATVTYLAAACYPQLFTRIILIDPVILSPQRLLMTSLLRLLHLQHRLPLSRGARRRRRIFDSREEALERFSSGRGMFRSWDPEFIQAYLDCGLKETATGEAVLKCHPEAEAMLFESAPSDTWRYARKIRCPVLAVRGETSITFTEACAQRLARRIPDFRWTTVRGTSHFIPMEKPAHLAGIILDFLEAPGMREGQGGFHRKAKSPF